MFSDDLKKSTLRVHQGLEKKLVNRIRKVKVVDDYVRLLELMYGYYQPLQTRIAPHITPDKSRDPGRQPGNILNDIRHFAPDHTLDLKLCEDLPELRSEAASLGALYVTEGSTLGGRIIARMISKQLDIPPDKGFTFFNAYGDDTEIMWNRFKDVLNESRSPAEKHELMESATNTFTKFDDWISHYESTSN